MTPEQVKKQCEEKALSWIVSDDTGASSKTLWACMMGVEPSCPSVPSDLADFGRCYRLLERIPEWKERLPAMAEKYKEWKPIIEQWDTIVAEYKKAIPKSYLIEEIVR